MKSVTEIINSKMKKDSGFDQSTNAMNTTAHGSSMFMGSVEKESFMKKQKEELTKSRIIAVRELLLRSESKRIALPKRTEASSKKRRRQWMRSKSCLNILESTSRS